MRITFICPFDLDRISGTPIRSRTIMRAATHCGEVRVITQRMSTPIENVTVRDLGICGLYTFTRLSLEELKKSSPWVVHGITTASVPAMLLYKLLKRSRVKILFEMHGWSRFELMGARRPVLRAIFYILDMVGLNISNTVIVMSHTQKEFLSWRALNPKKMKVLWGPVDSIPPLVSAPETPPLVVGYLGNSSSWQGLSYVLDAATLLKNDPSFIFRFAGFDPSNLENIPHSSSIHYHGILKGNETLLFWQGCTVLISPRVPGSVSNLQFPHKLSGYLSAGRPVIVSSANDQARIIKEAQCGLIVDPLNAESLVRALKDFARLSQEERQKMGERASRFAHKNFSFEILITTLKELYMIE